MESDDKSEQLKQLIKNGKTRGYILYDEIDELRLLAIQICLHSSFSAAG